MLSPNESSNDLQANKSNLLLLYESELFLNHARKANIFSSVTITIIGLIGNILTIFVFSQKRFRTNTSNVYFLCLAINDCLFLLVHFFQDTLRTFDQVYRLDYPILSKISQLINLTDKFDVSCRLINYLRYVLCFISVYIILAYTIQRLSIVRSPITNHVKSKRSAYRTIFMIVFISLLINSWPLYLFELNASQDPFNRNTTTQCDIRPDWQKLYNQISFAFLTLIMLVPILIIITCNFVIIVQTINAESKRKILQIKNSSSSKELNSLKKSNSSQLNNSLVSLHDSITRDEIKKINQFKSSYKRTVSDDYDTITRFKMSTPPNRARFLLSETSMHSLTLSSFKLKPYYMSVNQATTRGSGKMISSRKITKTLVLISFMYALFNLSYFVCLCIYFYDYFVIKLDQSRMNYLVGAIEISEIFYILNYGMIFYIYCASGSIFRSQLKYSRNIKKFYSFDF